MKGLVWGPTFKIADEQLEKIKQDYLNTITLLKKK